MLATTMNSAVIRIVTENVLNFLRMMYDRNEGLQNYVRYETMRDEYVSWAAGNDVAVKPAKLAKPEKPKKQSLEDYSSMKLVDLRNACKNLGLKTTGTKQALLDRLHEPKTTVDELLVTDFKGLNLTATGLLLDDEGIAVAYKEANEDEPRELTAERMDECKLAGLAYAPPSNFVAINEQK